MVAYLELATKQGLHSHLFSHEPSYHAQRPSGTRSCYITFDDISESTS